MEVSFTLHGKTATIDKAFKLAGITVPMGFKSDGMTTPRLFWFKWHPFSKYVAAAFVHDYCISVYGYPKARDHFSVALVILGCGKIERRLIYGSVRGKDYVQRNIKRIRYLFGYGG